MFKSLLLIALLLFSTIGQAASSLALVADTQQVSASLATYYYTIPNAKSGIYNVQFWSTFSQSSSLSVVVKRNSLAVYTSPVPGQSQTAMQFKTNFKASAGDAITIVMSSLAAVDNAWNAIKSAAAIGLGL